MADENGSGTITPAPAISRDEELAWERHWGPRAGIAAALGAILPIIGYIISASITSDAGPDDTSQLIFVSEKGGTFILSSVLLGLGAVAIAGALVYLYRATKFRRPELPRVAFYVTIIGAALYFLGQIAYRVILVSKADTFATTGNQTHPEAEAVFDASILQITGALGLAAQLALGFAFVLLSLNAMRAGLLTRFMGILGIFVGVLTVIPLGSPLPIVQSFWLAALGLLFARRWPGGGLPPAWEKGEAMAWPSQQEMREQRQKILAERQRRRAGEPAAQAAAPAEPAQAPEQPTRPHSSSKKRKGKKRR
jgi:hypothetical protein